jgi:hypothetical protein
MTMNFEAIVSASSLLQMRVNMADLIPLCGVGSGYFFRHLYIKTVFSTFTGTLFVKSCLDQRICTKPPESEYM